MPEKLPQRKENSEGEKSEQEPLEEIDLPEKVEEEDMKISSEDIDFLTDAGFDWEGRKEVETDTGIMIEIPKSDGQPAFVKPENFQAWVSHLRDERELTKAKEELDNTFGDEEGKKEQSPHDLEIEREQSERLKTNLYDLAETVKKLYVGFSERDKDNFNPLIYPEDIGMLLTSAQNLENVADNIKVNESYLSGAVSKITEAIKEIGNVSQGGGMYEDEDSLSKISYLLKNVEDQCDTVLSVAGTIDKYDMTILRASVSKLLESSQDRRLYVGRKLEAVRDYRDS